MPTLQKRRAMPPTSMSQSISDDLEAGDLHFAKAFASDLDVAISMSEMHASELREVFFDSVADSIAEWNSTEPIDLVLWFAYLQHESIHKHRHWPLIFYAVEGKRFWPQARIHVKPE